MATLNLSLFSYVRGYHNCLNIWSPQVGEILEVIADPTNTHNLMAVAVMKDEEVGGHSLKSISSHNLAIPLHNWITISLYLGFPV